MNKAKHTPGPWATDGRAVFTENDGANIYGYQIAIIDHEYSDYPSSEIAANIQLIAAAPELLEALKKIAAIEESVNRAEDYEGFGFEMVTIAKKAIAKAEGNQ